MSRQHIRKCTQRYYIFFSVAIFIFTFYACNATKKVPRGEYLLTKNRFIYQDGNAFSGELVDYVGQKPNRKLFYIFPLRLSLYNMANRKYDTLLNEYMTYPSQIRNQNLRDSLFIKYGMPQDVGKNLLFSRFIHTVGQEPVILDENKTRISAANIKSRLIYRGYWDADVTYSQYLDSATRKAQVDYTIAHREPTKISEYYYDIPDPIIREIYKGGYHKSHILVGDVLDQTYLEKEVARITQQMRQHGFYKFNGSNDEIYFTADTLTNRKQVPLILEIKKDSSNTPYKRATIGKVDVFLVEKLSDTIKTEKDSLRGINIYKDTNNQYRSIALWRPVILENGETYAQRNLDLTKRNISSMNNFRILDYKERIRKGTDSILDVSYYLSPLSKYELKMATDINYSQILNLGLSPSIDFTSRNVFGRAENFTASLSGTFGSVVNTKDIDKRALAYELSAQANLSFPRLLLPLSDKFVPKRYSPISNISLGVAVQSNIGLGRVNFNTGLNYLATVNEVISHRLSIFNTQLSLTRNKSQYYDFFPREREIRDRVFMNYSSELYQRFLNGEISSDALSTKVLEDISYQNSLSGESQNLFNTFVQALYNKDRQTQDVIISSMIYNFIYNEIGKKEKLNPFYFNGKVEFAGNALGWLTRSEKREGIVLKNTPKTIFDVPFSQFVKFDADVRKYFHFFNQKHTLVLRQFIGVGIPYGNSRTMPFIRSYFNGGSNDIRAWRIFGGLGPADSQLDEKVRAYAMNNIKLTTNIEYRFPLSSMFEGATFVDIGNIWGLENSKFNDIFKFNRFLSQMGVGAGMGLRINVAYITLRLDAAWRVHDPNKPLGQRWINSWHTPTVNFAFGYPF